MKTDLFRVFPYPKDGFTTDSVLQERLTQRSKRVDRHMKLIIVAFVVALLVAVVLLLIGIPWGMIGFILLSAVPPLAALFYLPPPKIRCSSCGERMKKVFAHINASWANNGEFLVCHHCRRAAFTHRTEARP